MRILRLPTLSLTLAVAVFAFGYTNPAFAGKPDCDLNPSHGSCKPKDDGGGDGDVYEVVISGDIGGGSTAPWFRSGGKKSIGGPAHNSGTLTEVATFFAALIGGPFTKDQANECFGVNNPDIRGGGLGTGKKDVAQAQFWFDAETFVEGSDRVVTYQLRYLGIFTGEPWLPANGKTSNLVMNEWRLTATNEGEAIKAISCIGEGIADVLIEVRDVTPQ